MSDHEQDHEHAARITDLRACLDFILAGRARFTLRSVRTGTRFTYRVNRGLTDDSPWFVGVLTGSDNESNYTFLGTIFGDGGYHHGKRSHIGADAPSAKAFAWVWKRLSSGEMPAECEIWHEGRCGACGRALTDPESIARGIGPVCAEKAAA